MSKTFKMVLVLLVVVSIASAVAAVFSFVGKEREYMKRLLLEDKLAATLKDKRNLEKEISSSKKEKEGLDVQIESAEAKLKELISGVDAEKEKTKSVLLDLAAKEDKIKELQEDIEKEKKEKLAISKKLEDLEFDYTKAESDVSRLKREKTELEKRLSDLKERSVDLDRIVVKPDANPAHERLAAPVKDLLRGRVLVVNKEYTFIVTDLGKEDEVKKGMVFEVKDARESLGRAEVDKVYDTMSSATVLPGGNINRMKKGDLIIESR
ncbi:MAG: hypothetical protein HQ532_00870 [Candidatus Omnitrophica bacterium]|nr:hypothetical protein [Candidatus Omnitrophota bacterium]